MAFAAGKKKTRKFQRLMLWLRSKLDNWRRSRPRPRGWVSIFVCNSVNVTTIRDTLQVRASSIKFKMATESCPGRNHIFRIFLDGVWNICRKICQKMSAMIKLKNEFLHFVKSEIVFWHVNCPFCSWTYEEGLDVFHWESQYPHFLELRMFLPENQTLKKRGKGEKQQIRVRWDERKLWITNLDFIKEKSTLHFAISTSISKGGECTFFLPESLFNINFSGQFWKKLWKFRNQKCCRREKAHLKMTTSPESSLRQDVRFTQSKVHFWNAKTLRVKILQGELNPEMKLSQSI